MLMGGTVLMLLSVPPRWHRREFLTGKPYGSKQEASRYLL